MKNDCVLVLELGSSTIRGMLAGRGANNTFIVRGYHASEYSGFFEGRFLDEDGLGRAISEVLSSLDQVGKKRTDKIYVGVPAEFASVITTTASMNFGERRRIRQADIDALYYSASEKAKKDNVEVLSTSPIAFKLDDGRSTLQPQGEGSKSLTGQLSIAYASRQFINIVNGALRDLGFDAVEYLLEPLAQALYCTSKENREELSLFVDVGDLTTSVAFVKGNGLVALSSFSLGGGHITNDLAEAFEISLSEADRLKRKIVLSLQARSADNYELLSDAGKIQKVPMIVANEVVGYRISTIGGAVLECIQLYSKEYIPYLPVYLTGAGISLVKGGRDSLAKCLGRNVAYGVPPVPGKKKPQFASIYSLVNAALGG